MEIMVFSTGFDLSLPPFLAVPRKSSDRNPVKSAGSKTSSCRLVTVVIRRLDEHMSLDVGNAAQETMPGLFPCWATCRKFNAREIQKRKLRDTILMRGFGNDCS